MSKKRMMSKQQRLYYEYMNKDRIKEELVEFIKQQREYERQKYSDIYERNYFT